MSVRRPILSAGALAKRGYQLVMGEHARLRLGTRLVPLLRRGNLFFLPVALPGQPWTAQQTARLSAELPAIEG
eukprot:12391018-Heterocapsa_arctica.AAC.1